VVGYDIQHKGFDKLDELSKKLIVPLKNAATHLAENIRNRALRGITATGQPFSQLGSYATTGRSKNEANRWWIPPTQPQPPGYLFISTQGVFKGWACYENYDRYLDLAPGARRRDFKRTGALWHSLGVRAMAVNRVKVSFYGSRKKGVAQAQVATLAGRKETTSVLQYSDQERRQFVAEIKANIDEAFARRIGQAVELGRIDRRLRGAERRRSELLGV
jgi:hypothetical protein